MANDRHSDAVSELATLIGNALASGAVDRRDLAATAHALLDGPGHRAERFGTLVASATLEALRRLPASPAEAAHEAFR